MSEDSSESAARGAGRSSGRGGRRSVPAPIGFVLAAIVGGVPGGLIVRATWASRNESTAAGTSPSSNGAFSGNFPQAFSHIGVIAAGVTLARATA